MRKLILFLFCCTIILYAIISFFSINKPILAEEEFFLLAAENIIKDGLPLSLFGPATLHPPLYFYLLAGFLKVLGPHIYSARLIGVFSFMVSTFLIFKITQFLAKEQGNKYHNEIAIFSSFLYTCLPVVVRGSYLLDIDNTILVPLFLLFIFVFLRFTNYPNLDRTKLLFSGLLLFLLLWAKITTTLALIFCIVIYLAFKKQIKNGLIIAFLGIFIFLFFWFIYCYFLRLDSATPFVHLIKQFRVQSVNIAGSGLGLIRGLMERMVRIAAWFSLPLLLLMVIVFFEVVKEFCITKIISGKLFLIFCGALIFLVYLFSGGIYYGFPRYQFPVISFFMIIIALSCFADIQQLQFSKLRAIIFWTIAFISVLFFIFLVGDPIYTVNYKLKEALVYSAANLKSIFLRIVIQIFLIPLLFFTLFYYLLNFNKRQLLFYSKMKLSLIIQLFIFAVALNIIQLKAPYEVGYCYGEEGTEKLIAFLKNSDSLKDKQILAPNDILYSLKLQENQYRLDAFWNSQSRLLKELKKDAVGCLVYSVPHNTIYQFKEIFHNEEITHLLNAHYRQLKIGTYTVWLRL
jgi:hypothetical protein